MAKLTKMLMMAASCFMLTYTTVDAGHDKHEHHHGHHSSSSSCKHAIALKNIHRNKLAFIIARMPTLDFLVSQLSL